MLQRILILQGHPDAAGGHLNHALAAAYREGAEQAGHLVQEIRLAELDFPLLRDPAQYHDPAVPDDIREAQRAIEAATHIVLFYPLWLGDMPALVKGFLEQVFRPAFVTGGDDMTGLRHTRLERHSARIVVTMGMPALFYRWFYRAHSLKSLERNVFRFAGFAPVRHTLIGRAGGGKRARRRRLRQMHALGRLAR